MRRLLDLPNFQTVGAGQRASLPIDPTGTYYGLDLRFTTDTVGGADQANMEAEIELVRLLINGRVQREMTAREIFDLNAYYGIPFRTGRLPIYFAEPWRDTRDEEDILAWSMADVATFTIEVDIAAGAGTVTLAAKALWRNFNQKLGAIVKYRPMIIPIGQIGPNQWFPRIEGERLLAFHLDTTAVTSFEVERDRSEMIQGTLDEIFDVYEDHGYTPQDAGGWVHIDFHAFSARLGDALPTQRLNAQGQATGVLATLQVDLVTTTADDIRCLVQTIGPRN